MNHDRIGRLRQLLVDYKDIQLTSDQLVPSNALEMRLKSIMQQMSKANVEIVKMIEAELTKELQNEN